MKEKVFSGKNINGQDTEFNVVATFDLNGRHYLFYTDMINMYVGYYETKTIKNIENKEEFDLLMSVYNALKINEFKHEFYDYGYTFYNGKNYKMIFDKYDKKRYFFEYINGRYVEAQGEVLEYFNKRFNSELISLSDSSNTQNYKPYNNKYRRLTITLSGITISLSVVTNILLNDMTLVQDKITDITGINFYEPVENVNDINDLIKKNEILDIKDKSFYLSLKELYNDNYKYMDYNYLKNVLPDLIVIYDKDNQEEYGANNNTSGQYFLEDNKIVIFNSNELNSNNLEVSFHEYLHALSRGGVAYDNPDGTALTEGITSLITSEYMTTLTNKPYTGSYHKQQTYVKMLFEIVGKDTILESYFGHDYNILVNKLCEYGEEEDAINLIRLINDEQYYETLLGADAYKDNKVINHTRDSIDSLYAKFFENAKGYPMEYDKLMCSYLDQIRKGNRANYEYYKKDNTFYTEVSKYYVNSKLVSNLAMVKYFYEPGIAIRANKADFKLQSNGKYIYKLSNGETMEYDTIPEYVLRKSMTNIITDETRKMNGKIY